MTSQFDKLDEVRNVARARATEDFAFFVQHVLGLGVSQELCVGVQAAREHGEDVELVLQGVQKHIRLRVLDALGAWLFVLGLEQGPIEAPTETFAWIFAEELRRAA